MKLFVNISVAILAVVVGFAAGLEFEKLRHGGADIEQLLQSDWREQHGTTIVSLGVLDTLEAGDTEKAKSLLARYIAIYYHAFKDREKSLPGQQRLIPSIETVSSRSPALETELQKQRK